MIASQSTTSNGLDSPPMYVTNYPRTAYVGHAYRSGIDTDKIRLVQG